MRWPWKRWSPEERQLEALYRGVSKPHDQLPIEDLVPLLVPGSFMSSGHWPGPIETLGIPGLALTWAVLQPSQTMVYVNRDLVAHWESRGLEWRDAALANLRRLSAGRLCTHEFRDASGSLYAVACMHEDGVGPARLLLEDELDRLFPAGYLVAVPERSCGLALSARATSDEQAKLQDLAKTCYERGTAPLIEGFHPAAALKILS